MRKSIASHVSEEGIYPEYIKNTYNTIEKWTKVLNSHFSKKMCEWKLSA
jgi:hypothetical protein